LPGVQDALFGP